MELTVVMKNGELEVHKQVSRMKFENNKLEIIYQDNFQEKITDFSETVLAFSVIGDVLPFDESEKPDTHPDPAEES